VHLPSNGDLENTAYPVLGSVSFVAETCLPCRCLATIVLVVPLFRLSLSYHTIISYGNRKSCAKRVGFWQQTLWSSLFSRTTCCLVHCCQFCRILRIDMNLLHSKCRYQCTRLHRDTVTYILLSVGDKGSFAIHFNILQVQLGHIGHQFSWLLVTERAGLTCETWMTNC
jgi:hypothetical protein